MHPSQTAYAKNPKLTKREGEALLVVLSESMDIGTPLASEGIKLTTFNRAVAKLAAAVKGAGS